MKRSSYGGREKKANGCPTMVVSVAKKKSHRRLCSNSVIVARVLGRGDDELEREYKWRGRRSDVTLF